MSIDALFPAVSVVKHYFEETYLPNPTLPDWAGGVNIAPIALVHADPILQILALAGWRPTLVRFLYGNVQTFSNGVNYCNIDLATREATFAPWSSDFAIRAMETGDIHLVIEAEEINDGADRHFGFDLPDDPDNDETSSHQSWMVNMRPEGTLHLHVQAYPRTMDGPDAPSGANEAAYMNYREKILDRQIGLLVKKIGGALIAAVQAEEALPYNIFDDPEHLPGLTWLLLPQMWFASTQELAQEDLFVDQIFKGAEQFIGRWTATHGLSGMVAQLTYPSAASFDQLGRQADIIFKSRTDLANKAELQGTLVAVNGAATERSPLKDALTAASYFDLICMMVHTGRINPPWINVTGIIGNWVDPSAPDPEAPALTAERDHSGGRQMYILYLFGVPAVHLFQENHPRNSDLTPNIWENVAWEYLGVQPDGDHVIGLTLGRGVLVSQLGTSGPLKLDIFRAQSADDFRRPIERIANLEPVAVTNELELDLYDIPSPIDTSSPLFVPPERIDDLSATAAQALDHEMLRAQKSFVAFIPYDLDDMDATSAENVPASRSLSNFSPDTPPVLLVRQTDTNEIRFEWYRQGLSDGNQGTVTWAATLRPKNPHAANFGYCWSMDYGFLTHEPLSEDMLARHVTYSLLDTFLSMITGVFQPLLAGTPLAADNTLENVGQAIRPFGVAFFRLWFSGDVEIDIDRRSDSDADFYPEIVKVAEALDLPEQGVILPARSVLLGDYEKNSRHEDGVENTGVWAGSYTYHRMIRTGDPLIPEWRSADMPVQFHDHAGRIDNRRINHVGVAESHVNSVLGNWVPKMLSWSDTKYFIVSDADWQVWKDGAFTEGFTKDQRLPGELRIDPTIEWIVFTLVSEVIVGFIPYVGDATDVAEFVYAYETGQDKWGQPVPTWQLYLMGVAAGIPFVSGGLVKAGVRIGSEFLDAIPLNFLMRGAGLDEFLSLLPTTWRASKTRAEDIQILQASAELVTRIDSGPSTGTLDHSASVMALLARQDTTLGDIATATGRSLSEIVAEVDGAVDMALIVKIDGAQVRIKIPKLSQMFTDANARRASDAQLTFAQFITNRRYSTGLGRVLAEMFSLIRYVDTGTTTVTVGVTRRAANWAALDELAEIPRHKKPALQMIAALGRSNAVNNALPLLERPMDVVYVTRYADEIETVLAELKHADNLEFLISSKGRSLPYTIVAIARTLELVKHSIIKEGLPVEALLPTSKVARNLSGLSDLAVLKHRFYIDALTDFLKRAISQSGYQHGYHFEFDVALVLRDKFDVGNLVFTTQAKLRSVLGNVEGLPGPDFLASMPHGFSVLQLKALKKARSLFGTASRQDSMAQSITDLVRMYRENGGVAGTLDEGMANRFTGLFVSIIDLDYLTTKGADRVRTIFGFAGGEVVVHGDMLADLSPAQMARMNELAFENAGGDLVFNSLESWEQAAKFLGEDPFREITKRAMELQAMDMQALLQAFASKEALRAVLSNPGKVSQARRYASTFAGVLNEIRPKGTPRITAEELMQPGTLGNPGTKGGADIIYENLGLPDNWFDTFTQPVAGAPPFHLDVKVVDLDELRAMGLADFGGAL